MRIKKIEINQPEHVYDIEVADNHNFFVESCCVHNCRRLLKKLGKAKKDPKDLEKWKKMVACAKETAPSLGIAPRDIDLLCQDLITLSAYSFNKSHAAAYSYLAMEEVYLSRYFKPFFYAVNLAVEADGKDTIKGAIESCRRSGFEVLPPDINNSNQHFSPSGKNLYFGLNDIKGIGENPALDIIANRPYDSPIDFITKNIGNSVNKRITMSLINSGAMDSLFENGEKDRKYYENLALKFYELKGAKKLVPLLKEKWEEAKEEVEYIETSPDDLLEYEENYLGGQFFHNKFTAINPKIEMLYSKGYCLRDFNELRKKNLSKQYVFVYLTNWRVIQDKKGRDMSLATIEDRNGEKQMVPFFFNIYPYVCKKYFGDGFYLLDLYPSEEGKVMPGSRKWMKSPTEMANIMAKVPGF